MKNLKYIWWLEHGTGGVGSWPTKKAAMEALKQGREGNRMFEGDWKPVKHEVGTCPTCGKPAEKDIIEGLGECLRCDHVRSDI